MLLAGCQNRPYHYKEQEDTGESQKEALLKVNKFLVKKDREMIKNFADRRGWEMKTTDRGLYYQIYSHGDGPKATHGAEVTISYTLQLLDGTFVTPEKQRASKTLQLGSDDNESGLYEGILLMHAGDQARFIIPPHLGQGLLGTDKKIPPRAVLIYDIKLESVKAK
jgi:FKBP-type peptidyl-prolyl cis-trans isomerase